jgi:DNA-binding MarR family transcriptional regulator
LEDTVDKPIGDIEFEMMMLGRYQLVASGAERDGGRLERSAYLLLSRINAQGPMTIRELSEAFHLDPSTVNRQTAAMLREGLVERAATPDKIARSFRLTDQGRRRLDEGRDFILNRMEKIFGEWTADEVAVFAANLKRFSASIEQISGLSWPRD